MLVTLEHLLGLPRRADRGGDARPFLVFYFFIRLGFTFITPKYQRSYISTHAKYCLLKFAFEEINAIRVEFKTHERNDKSRNAIARLGATFEGILRNQRILSDGTFRSTAIFSIINSEWEKVKSKLEEKMAKDYV